jgi:GntR family transcriptional regulator/MocR family aminotransferase
MNLKCRFLKPPSRAEVLDKNGRVIYVGSFKIAISGLRLGYSSALHLSSARPAPCASSISYATRPHQRTVTYFLSRGHYDALVVDEPRLHDRAKPSTPHFLNTV